MTNSGTQPETLQSETEPAFSGFQSTLSKGKDYPTRVLNDMNTGVLVLDRKANIIFTNPPASRILELPENVLTGQTPFSLLSLDSKNDAFMDCILEAVQNRNYTHVGTIFFHAPSGRHYDLRISSSYLENPESPDSEVVLTFTDETKAGIMRRKYMDSSRCFVIGIFCVCIWTLIYAMWEFLGRPISVDFLTHGSELMGLIMTFFIFRYTSFTFTDLGITLEKPRETLRTGLVISGIAVAFLVLVKLIGRWIDPTLFRPEAPFVDFSLFTWHQVAYLFIAGLQEFIARSILQNNIRRIMVGRHVAFKAILLSSMMFATLHIQHGFFFMIGAGVLAALEGILYEKRQNIFAVWMVHWFFGVAGTLLSLVSISH